MPETATKTTTPTRRRAAAKTTTAAKSAPKATPPADDGKQRITLALEFVENTKSYAKFKVPESYKGVMVGNLYMPLGTEEVKILVIGSDGETDE